MQAIFPTIPGVPGRHPQRQRIALLFNARDAHARDVIGGVAAYVRSRQASWDLFMADEHGAGLEAIPAWDGDGIIADAEDPLVAAVLGPVLGRCRAKVVAVGGSSHDERGYPAAIPYVASDNAALVARAYHHLIEHDMRHFAMFSEPDGRAVRAVAERERAFARLLAEDGLAAEIQRGAPNGDGGDGLRAWLRRLPKPVGIVAVNDACARRLLQACATAGLDWSAEVRVTAIGNDPLVRSLSHLPLDAVLQGGEAMGRTAAALLHQLLHGQYIASPRVMAPPAGVQVAPGARPGPGRHPHVMRALHFIRHHARHGIKSTRVAAGIGLSRSGLDAHFRRDLGHSVHEELLRYKLEMAKRYLAAKVPIAEVAGLCGFTSVQYLYTVFAREIGCTPRVFQERQHGALAG